MKTKIKIKKLNLPICFVFLLLIVCSCNKEKSEALVVRPINNKTILKNHSNGVDYIFDNLEVNAELVIEDGVHIQVRNNAKINISSKGKLIVLGTKVNTVIIEGQNGKAWQGISIVDGVHHLKGLHLKNASSRGKNFGSIVTKGNSELNLENVEISNSGEGSAILADGLSHIIVGPGCEISDAHAPFEQSFASNIDIANDLTLRNVALECVLLSSKSQSSCKGVYNLDGEGLPYLLSGTLAIQGYQLNISAGAVLMLYEGSSINVLQRGQLFVNGTSHNPVQFKCVNPAKTWRGFYVSNAEVNINRTIIKNVASNDSSHGIFTLRNNCTLNIRNTDLRTNKTKCAITTFGSIKLNPDFRYLNKFNLMHALCQY